MTNLLKPGGMFGSFEKLWDLLKEYARLHNFRLRVSRHEKRKGSGIWRGRFTCGGCNVKTAKKKKQTDEECECTFCVPFTHGRDLDGSHYIKEETGDYEPLVFNLEHNHEVHGLLTVLNMVDKPVRRKTSRQQLTETELGIIRYEAGNFTDIKVLMVTELTEQTELLQKN